MADYSYMGRNKKMGVRFNDDAKNGGGWNGPGYFSKVEARHDFLRGPSINGADGRGTTTERPPNHHQSLFSKAAEKAAEENAYRPPRQTGMYTREYVFGSKRISEPPLDTSDAWTRPSRAAGWPMPPEAPLSKVTNDTQAAANYLKGFVRPSTASTLFGSDHKSSAYSPAPVTSTVHGDRKSSAYDPPVTTNMYGDRRSSAYTPPVTTNMYGDRKSSAYDAPAVTTNMYGDRKSSAYDAPAVTTNMYGSDRRSSAYDPPVTTNMYGGDRRSSAYSPPAYEGRRDQSGITPTIDSKEAARKYGGQFIW